MIIHKIVDKLNGWRERYEFHRRMRRYRQRKLERQMDNLTDHGLLDRMCGACRD